MDFDFSGLGFRPGQFAVVTGAGNGIGRATSLMLARAGVTVGAWDIDEASLTAVGEELNSIGPAPHLQVGDLTQQEFRRSCMERNSKAWRRSPIPRQQCGPARDHADVRSGRCTHLDRVLRCCC